VTVNTQRILKVAPFTKPPTTELVKISDRRGGYLQKKVTAIHDARLLDNQNLRSCTVYIAKAMS